MLQHPEKICDNSIDDDCDGLVDIAGTILQKNHDIYYPAE